MHEDLAKIDVTPADALKTLKDEQDVLDGRIKAMDEMKASVAETVYLRVRADYMAKRDALETQARPLREQAREQFAKLLAILATVEAEQETIKLDRQETELRHQLGEYDKKEFDKRIKAIDAAATEKDEWQKRAHELRDRFLKGVRSEDELRPASAYVTGEVAKPAPPPAAVPPPAVAVSSTMVMAAPPPVAPPPAAPPPPVEGTMVMPAIKPAAAAPPPVSDATVMFRPARFVPQNPEAGKTTYALALKPLSIGSDAANDIRIGGPGVEPKHAQIAPTPKGYAIVDFDTKHGTRVNAERIKERLLVNEDVVQVGAARFVFRVS
jgi:hypothetical protein